MVFYIKKFFQHFSTIIKRTFYCVLVFFRCNLCNIMSWTYRDSRPTRFSWARSPRWGARNGCVHPCRIHCRWIAGMPNAGGCVVPCQDPQHGVVLPPRTADSPNEWVRSKVFDILDRLCNCLAFDGGRGLSWDGKAIWLGWSG